MVGDPIGDLIVRIKNAGMVGHETVVVPFSKFKYAVAEALAQAGYVASVEKSGKKIRKVLKITLAYNEDGTPRINDVKRISKPGRRLYARAKDIFAVRNGYGSRFFSTPLGILTDKQAREKHVGGEILFEIH